ncbi:redox-sensing transcriptional repressor Rex [Sporomusa aerivorans]|uniref:redox-sensing transcriptional repressor Rex n=1 Tax=Sporomusa aerivorans TaxID=204936 RepID=UPI00352AC68E
MFELADVSRHTIHRMALYHSVLKIMKENGVSIVVSSDLGRRTGIQPHVVRKDFSCFGEFGTKGVGYQIEYLLRRIEKILGYDTVWNAVLVCHGMPALPSVVYSYWPPAVNILSVIDLSGQNVGLPVDNLDLAVEQCENLVEIINTRNISIGIISTPPSYIQETVNHLIKAGIQGIVNFSAYPVFVPDSVAIIQVNVASLFSQMTFQLKHVPTKVPATERSAAE